MSLYDICYVNNTAEQERLKVQQKQIQKALRELSVSTKIQEKEEKERLITRQYLTKAPLSSRFELWMSSMDCFIGDESRPYSPYYDATVVPSNSSATSVMDDIASSFHSNLLRQRTPSMVSSASLTSNNSSQNTSHEYMDEAYQYTSILDVSERDAYGFKRPIQWVSAKHLNEVNKKYSTILEKQAKKWKRMMESNKAKFPPMCPQLTSYVRKGIPHDLRAKAWLHYSGAQAKLESNSGVYTSYLEKAKELGELNRFTESIKKDLHRTFPDNSFYSCDIHCEDGTVIMSPESNPKLQKLERILLAFSIHSPDIGHCQSFNAIAGFLLLILEEEHVFWMLVTIVHDYFPSEMLNETAHESSLEQTVLMMLIYEKMPGLWSKISSKRCFWECEQKGNLPSITFVTSHWLSNMYLNILPVETVLRVWDCFFVEGFQVLYQVALTIIKLSEPNIWKVNDAVDILQILQKMPNRLVDCHQFMESIFSSNGVANDFDIQDINRKRDLFRSRKEQRQC